MKSQKRGGKKKPAKKKLQKRVSRTKSTAIVVRVETAPQAPSVSELVQPIGGDGKALSIPKTWVSEKQIIKMVQRTPQEHIYHRPAKGGGTWSYVTGSYVEKVLNYVFGFLWDFEIVEHGVQGNQVWVKGRLTVKNAKGDAISKMQFGRADIKKKKGSSEFLDFGNDLKAAATDSLKKCASLFGIASDIYGITEYKQETGRDVRDDDTPVDTAPAPAQPQRAYEQPVAVDATYQCHGATKGGCGNDITEAEHTFSKRVFKKPLCRSCQALLKQSK